MNWILAFSLLLPLFVSAADQQSRCALCQHCASYNSVTTRGVNNLNARWINKRGVFPNPPDQKTVVTYSFLTTTNGNLVPIQDANFVGAATMPIILEAIESWNDVAGITLRRVDSGGQIQIYALNTTLGALGNAGNSLRADSGGPWYISDSSVWLRNNYKSWTPTLLRQVMSHEIGHALGLFHSKDTTSVMGAGAPGPTADDRFYIQYLYGSAPAMLSALPVQLAPTKLKIRRAAPKQTGTDSDPTYEGGLAISTGTGTKTQNNVVRYILERKTPSDAMFFVINENVKAGVGGQNSDGLLSHEANSFEITDNSVELPGTYIYRVKAVHQSPSPTEPYSSEVSIVVTTVNANEPKFDSGITITPNPLQPNQTAIFTCSGSGISPLSFKWDFGDGSSSVGQSAVHAYTAAGIYLVALTLTDANGVSITTSANVTVDESDGPTPPDVDSDDDGVSDINEVLDGTNLNDPGSFVLTPLTVSRLRLSIRFDIEAKDAIQISGIFPNLLHGFSPNGKQLKFDVGGATRAVTLDEKGHTKTESASAGLGIKFTRNKKTKKVSFVGGNVPFKASLKSGSWSSTWVDEGLDGAADAKKLPRGILVDVKFNGRRYGSTVNGAYSSKAENFGKFFEIRTRDFPTKFLDK